MSLPLRPELAPVDVVDPLESDERDLVRRIQAGDAAAFETMFHAHYDGLCSFTASYVKSRDLAEEHVQDVLMWVWEQRHRWDVRGGIRNYLYTAARNAALNAVKRQRIADRWEATAVTDLSDAGLMQNARPIDDDVILRDTTRAVCDAINRLPARRRLALTLRWRHDLSYAEIARAMGITTKAVETSLAKAVDTLRRDVGWRI
jgi:RNA polymerase sigma-70 factor (ECF subfamily)